MHQPTEEEMTEDETKVEAEADYAVWKARIDAAKEGPRKNWLKDSDQAYDEYLAEANRGEDGGRTHEDRYPLYWASLKSYQPMIYSRPGVPVAEKANDDLDDNVARLACVALEKAAKYLTRPASFHRAMCITRDTYLHSAKTAPRVMFEATITDEPVKVYYTQSEVVDPETQQPVMVWINDRGEMLTQDAEMLQDEQGIYMESPTEKLEKVEVFVDPLYREDYLHNPDARHEGEIWWKAFRACLDRREFAEKFGKEAAEGVTFGSKEDEKDRDGKANRNPKAVVWEIWDSRERDVLFLPENGKSLLTPVGGSDEDPYELAGFFPTPAFMLGTVGDKHMYPTPDYIQLRPMIEQLHGLYKRLRLLIRAVRRRGLFDSEIPELMALQDALDEAEYIGVPNFKELIGEGGLEKIVKHFPTGELSDAITETVGVSEQLEAKFDMLYGIPDIMRGSSDPNETASAQQQKGHYLSLRGSTPAQQFQEMLRETVEIMLDLAFKKFPESKLREITGASHWKPEDQQFWPQVLMLCQDDQDRQIRINIETDSTITANKNAEVEQKNYLAKTIFDGIQAIAAAAQAVPEMVAVGAEALLLVVQGTIFGKNVEESMKQAVEALKQPKQPEQAPPDPAIQKAQIDQAMQEKELAFKTQELKLESMLKQAEIQAMQAKTDAEIQIAAFKAEADANTKAMQTKLSAMQLQIEKAYAAATMAEKFMEERRLGNEEKQAEHDRQTQAVGGGETV